MRYSDLLYSTFEAALEEFEKTNTRWQAGTLELKGRLPTPVKPMPCESMDESWVRLVIVGNFVDGYRIEFEVYDKTTERIDFAPIYSWKEVG